MLKRRVRFGGLVIYVWENGLEIMNRTGGEETEDERTFLTEIFQLAYPTSYPQLVDIVLSFEVEDDAEWNGRAFFSGWSGPRGTTSESAVNAFSKVKQNL
ncbi:hypothetical protein [Ammoniphilus oxalaticus]|nr:hypothetical protein [Ammoniphilus oxalaticus]